MDYIVIFLFVAIGLVFWIISFYRSCTLLNENIKNAMTQIGVHLSSQWDALNSLLELIKGYNVCEYNNIMETIKDRCFFIKNLDSEDLNDLAEEFKGWLKDNNVKRYNLSETAQARFSEWFNKNKSKYLINSSFSTYDYDFDKIEGNDKLSIYNNLPILFQNIICSIDGFLRKKKRYNKKFFI